MNNCTCIPFLSISHLRSHLHMLCLIDSHSEACQEFIHNTPHHTVALLSQRSVHMSCRVGCTMKLAWTFEHQIFSHLYANQIMILYKCKDISISYIMIYHGVVESSCMCEHVTSVSCERPLFCDIRWLLRLSPPGR